MHPEPSTTCDIRWVNHTQSKAHEQYAVVLVSNNYIVSSNFTDNFPAK